MNFENLYLIFFCLHIPITIFIDSSVFFGPYYFSFVKNLLKFHVNFNKDFLIKEPELWFKSFIFIEIVFQLPIFFYCSYSIYKKLKSHYVLMIMYGVNTAISTFTCLLYIANREKTDLSNFDRLKLFTIYLPFFMMSLLICADYNKKIMKILKDQKSSIYKKDKSI